MIDAEKRSKQIAARSYLVFISAQTTVLADNGGPGAKLIDFLEAKAKGGTGLIITEAVNAHPSGSESKSELCSLEPFFGSLRNNSFRSAFSQRRWRNPCGYDGESAQYPTNIADPNFLKKTVEQQEADIIYIFPYTILEKTYNFLVV